MLSRHRSVRSGNAGHRCSASAEQTSLLAPSDLALRGPFFWGRGSGCQSAIDLAAHRRPYTRTRLMKCLTIVCLGALLTLSAAPDAFAWGAVTGPRGGAAYRGPMGGAAVRTPSGAAAVRGPYGGAAARGPYGGTAYRAPGYGGGAVYRGPVYGGTVYRPGVGAGVAVGAAAGVAVGAAAGAAAASTYPSCYYPPYYCYPPPYYQPPAW